jgi:hypothetical protein
MRNATRWLTVGLVLLGLAACSAAESGSDATSGDVAPGMEAPADEGSSAGGSADDASGGAGESGELPDLGEGLNLAESGRSIITTGTVTLSSEDPIAAAADITALVTRLGGWVEGESLQAGSESRDPRAHLVLRIPSRDVGTALGELSEYGKVESVDLERTDVTVQVRDLAARIRAVEMSVARMEEFLAGAVSREDLIEAEQMLTERQSQLEQLLSQQATLDEQVSMSTLSVDVVVPEEVPPPPPEPEEPRTGFLGGLLNGWEAFLAFGSAALLVLGALLPWLAFAALVTAIVLWVRRWYLRTRPERPARPPRPSARRQAPPAAWPYPPVPPMGGPAGAPAAPPAGAPPVPPAPSAGPAEAAAGPGASAAAATDDAATADEATPADEAPSTPR